MVAALKMTGFGAAPLLLFSIASFLMMVLLVAPETAFRIAEWCSRPFTNLVFPNDRLSKPPLSYLLAREYTKQSRLEDAVEQYAQIIHFYPTEKDAYIEVLAVTKAMGDDELHNKYASLFKKRFHQAPPVASMS